MNTLYVTFTPQLVGAQLDLGAPALTGDPALVRQCTGTVTSTGIVEIAAPTDTVVQFRVAGFSVGGQTYAITASSSFEAGAWQVWTGERNDAVSPLFASEGGLELQAEATPTGGTQGATTTTVTVRINKGGKPDGFLQGFVPG